MRSNITVEVRLQVAFLEHSQCQVLIEHALDHPVHVLDAVVAGAEPEVLGQRLLGVVGGVQQRVDRLNVGGAHDGEVQPLAAVLEVVVEVVVVAGASLPCSCRAGRRHAGAPPWPRPSWR